MLTREEILGANDIVTEAVDVPEWGGQVIVRSMTGDERDAWEQTCMEAQEGKANSLRLLKARIAVLSIVNDDGNRIFTDGDIPALNAKSGAAIDRVFQVAKRISHLKADDVEELAKN